MRFAQSPARAKLTKIETIPFQNKHMAVAPRNPPQERNVAVTMTREPSTRIEHPAGVRARISSMDFSLMLS
jgi:hypothetical protein